MNSSSPHEKLALPFKIPFNLSTQTDEISFRKMFCNGAIASVEKLYSQNKIAIEPAVKTELMNFVIALKALKSNRELIHVLSQINKKAIGVNPVARELMKHILNYFERNKKSVIDLNILLNESKGEKIKKHLVFEQCIQKPNLDFKYENLLKLRNDMLQSGIISPSEHIAEARQNLPGKSDDFIYFTAAGLRDHMKVNPAKLRLSVDINKLAQAWNLIKDEFLSADCPISHFKIIDIELANESFEASMKALDANNQYTPEQVRKYKADMLEAHERLTKGGQITIYLPAFSRMEEKLSNDVNAKIVIFLNKIMKILEDNQIKPGPKPFSDAALCSYISGRLSEKTEGLTTKYLTPEQTAGKSINEVPVLKDLSVILNSIPETKKVPTKSAPPLTAGLFSQKNSPETHIATPTTAPNAPAAPISPKSKSNS
jgi:hypothetical protein